MEAQVKKRKSVLRREKKNEDKIAKQSGPLNVSLNNVPTSTRKMRLVADLIRGVEVNKALAILRFQAKSGAVRIEKLLLSAMANWENTHGQIDEHNLIVSKIFVDGGPIMKRLRPAPQGRAHRVRKRSNHVTLEITSLGKNVSVSQEIVVDQNEIQVEEKPKATKAKAKKSSKE